MQKQLHILLNVFILAGVIMLGVVLPSESYAQTVVGIYNNTACSNTEALIPVEVENFEDIVALTIYIQVDTTRIDFIGVENVNSVFSSGNFVTGINASGQIVLTWISLPPGANLDNGVLCYIRVLLKKNTVEFDFLENSEIAQSDLTIIENVEYFDGILTKLNSYNIDPISQTVLEESPASIEVLELPESINCQWQKMEDENWINLEEFSPYSGVNTSKLSIESVSLEMHDKLFRCLLSNDFCSDGSVESELFVTPNGVSEVIGQTNTVNVYPNPVLTQLNCHFNASVLNAELKLVDSKGVSVMSKQLSDVFAGDELSLNFNEIKAGLYILQLFSNGKKIMDLKIMKT